MIAAEALGLHLRDTFVRAEPHDRPFRHWLFDEALPQQTARAIAGFAPTPAPVGDTLGRRETHNESRIFFSPDRWQRFPLARAVADALQNPETTSVVGRVFGRTLTGSFLRIEYCQDTEGFWLEPHTDIAAKWITIVIYLSDGPGADGWGTDLYDADKNWVGRAPAAFNQGLVFVPGGDTWHGWAKRPIDGVRRSLIVNYVSPDWRSRHELSFPDRPV